MPFRAGGRRIGAAAPLAFPRGRGDGGTRGPGRIVRSSEQELQPGVERRRGHGIGPEPARGGAWGVLLERRSVLREDERDLARLAEPVLPGLLLDVRLALDQLQLPFEG